METFQVGEKGSSENIGNIYTISITAQVCTWGTLWEAEIYTKWCHSSGPVYHIRAWSPNSNIPCGMT